MIVDLIRLLFTNKNSENAIKRRHSKTEQGKIMLLYYCLLYSYHKISYQKCSIAMEHH